MARNPSPEKCFDISFEHQLTEKRSNPMAYHRSSSGLWLRCVAKTPDSCHYGGAQSAPHSSGQAAIAADGGGIIRHKGKLVKVLPTGEEGYMTIAENGQVATYDNDGKPISLKERLRNRWNKEEALAKDADSEERIRLQKEIDDALTTEAAIVANRQARKTQAWKMLSEEIGLKSQEYADAHFGEAYAYGNDEELDNLYAQRWALISEKAPAGYSRSLAEAEGASEEDLAEIDRENAKAQAVADKIREEQEALAANVGARQLTSSQRRLRGWIATKGSKAGRNLAKAAKGQVAASANAMANSAQAAGDSVASGARSELDRFKSELGDEIDTFEQDLSKEFGIPITGAPSSQIFGLKGSPSSAVAESAKSEQKSRKLKASKKPKAKGKAEKFDLFDGLIDDLFKDQESTEDLWDLGDDSDLFDDFDS